MCVELDCFIEDVKKIYGDNLDRVILFGSRARGDNRPDSDYDVMILTSLPRRRLFAEKLDLARDASYYDTVMINPISQNTELFNMWKDSSPLYKNIVCEGKVLYDRCD